MLISFKHRGVELFFEMLISFNEKNISNLFLHNSGVPIPINHADRILRIFDRLDLIDDPKDMDIYGYEFQILKNDKSSLYSIALNDHWRITFGFDGNNVINVK